MRYKCKTCATTDTRAWQTSNPERRRRYIVGYREKNKDRMDAYQAAYRTENRELLCAKKAKYYEENRADILAAQAEHRAENRQTYLERQAHHRAANRERLAAAQAEYRAANPYVYAEWATANPEVKRANKAAYRSRLLGAEGDHTAEDIRSIYRRQDGRCHYCGADLEPGYHVDHKTPLAREGSNSPENLACACPTCNFRKHAMTEEEFFARRPYYRL